MIHEQTARPEETIDALITLLCLIAVILLSPIACHLIGGQATANRDDMRPAPQLAFFMPITISIRYNKDRQQHCERPFPRYFAVLLNVAAILPHYILPELPIPLTLTVVAGHSGGPLLPIPACIDRTYLTLPFLPCLSALLYLPRCTLCCTL